MTAQEKFERVHSGSQMYHAATLLIDPASARLRWSLVPGAGKLIVVSSCSGVMHFWFSKLAHMSCPMLSIYGNLP